MIKQLFPHLAAAAFACAVIAPAHAQKSSDKDETTTATKKSDNESTASKETAKAKGILSIPVEGSFAERGNQSSLFSSNVKSLQSYFELLRKVKDDKAIETVVFRIGSSDLSLAYIQELTEHVKDLRENGKKTVAILEDDGQSSYLMALACEKIVIPPSGSLMLRGISADSYFLKNLLGKLGVKAQFQHVGQYKSYGETFTEDSFTTPALENMNELVDSMFEQYVNTVAQGRKLSQDEARAAFDKGLMTAGEAKEAKLIDQVAYADEIFKELTKKDNKITEAKDYIKKSSSSKSDISLLSLLMGGSSKSDSSESTSNIKRVALLYAIGGISQGSNGGLGSDTSIASDDFIEQLEDLKNDDKIEAVILRVNSPGGSAFASDLIWRKIEELKKEKPVIASMSSIAASGGYYISMGADKIVADPGTLTGSIGVVGGKANLKGLYDKIGVTKNSVAKGAYAHLFSETQDFTPQDQKLIQDMMQRTYDEFVTKAAEGRGKTYDDIHKVAQGRVWTGEKAKEAGLVDELGGLSTAIALAKDSIGVKRTDKVRLIAYPKEKSFVEILQNALGTGSISASALPVKMNSDSLLLESLLGTSLIPDGLKTAMRSALQISTMLEKEKVLAVMPFVLDIKH